MTNIKDDAGCRGPSEWFMAKPSTKYGSAAPAVVVRRRAWPQDDHWEDNGETYYRPDYFDAWRPLSLYTTAPPGPSVAVKVKPLEWRLHPDGDAQRYEGISTVGNNYVVFMAWWGKHRKWGWVGNGEFHDTLDTAKAAAQADYEQRIISALITAPQDDVSAYTVEAQPVHAIKMPEYRYQELDPRGGSITFGGPTVPTLVDDPYSASGKRVEYRPSDTTPSRPEVSK